jgi:hypothetical protein
MKVVISEVSDDQPAIVQFECAVGRGRGKWIVGQPQRGAEYDVELAVPVLSWGEQIFISKQGEPGVALAGDSVVITCLIEAVDIDGVLKLRLGEAVVLADATGVRAGPGEWVDVRLPSIDLYDTNT